MMDQHDPIEKLLRDDARAHRERYIDNAGFSERVTDTLPARARLSRRMRALVPACAALIATVFAFLFAGGLDFAIDVGMDMLTASLTRSVWAFLAIAVTFIAACWAVTRE
jgi:hypothetical protein